VHTEDPFLQAFIYLLAAVVSVPIAKRLGLGSVLGYLVAGALIGPFALGLVGGGSKVLHVAEFGVVMMLFLIGLELQPSRLWNLRRVLVGLGGSQVALTALALCSVALVSGLQWKMALAVGMVLALSSTAIVLQSLTEKGLMRTPGGEASFSVLLFQDIAVIPMLVVLPLLATLKPSVAENAHGSAIHALPPWLQGLTVFAAVASIIVGGRFLLRPVFRYIAETKLREMFTATALLLVIGIALLMQAVGLSAALGTFVAGVVLAESEYRHQLEADIEPFKGLLLGLFFIAVGAGIDFGFIVANPGLIAGIVGGLLAIKFAILFVLGKVFKLSAGDDFLFAFALAQGGEFAFVLLSLGVQSGVVTDGIANPLVAAVALSMAVTPLLLILNERYVKPRFAAPKQEERPADEIDEHEPQALIAGFGRFGHVVGRMLRGNGVQTTVLDRDADWVDTLRKFGLHSYYGDATRPELLKSAGAEKARLFVVALDDREQSLRLVDTLRREFPHLVIFARALDRIHAYDLMKHGVTHIHRETLGSSLDLSVDVLEYLGFAPARARRAAQIFREHDEKALQETVRLQEDHAAYISIARQHIQNLENLLRADLAENREGE
jgi:monovalent cation:proton antiporter-2 (CPA2) family protein